MSSPLSGFTAVPNPQMLAFMPIQSYLMMYFAGAGWQIGKRKMSAIPNSEFNQMSANELLKGLTAELKESIPTLEKSMNDVTPLIRILIEQYGDFIREAIKAIPEAFGNIFQQSGITGGSTVQNVRLSQGSQQFQRDRELYLGGQSAKSQFQLDQEKQQERNRQQAALDAAARAREEAERLTRERSIITDATSSGVAELHQRWGKTSTQSLNIAVRTAITKISTLYNELKNIPQLREVTRYRNVFSGARGRRVAYKVKTQNPAWAAQKVKIKTQQQLAVDIQKYLQWRKSRSQFDFA